ncbi:6993_t:CDS:2, partial [Racocetra persica]
MVGKAGIEPAPHVQGQKIYNLNMKTDEATIPREHHNEKNTPVRTRFAPSPTGELHIGGARTALFNYLLAKKTGGQFVLRVEDTDQQRNQAEFIHQQYQDLVWLGCEPDESPFKIGSYGPYQQSQRLAIYQKYLQQLLVVKKAYHCFCSAAELAQEKFEFQKSGR